jgi:hypothetical protein
MSFWNGTRWVHDRAGRPAPSRHRLRDWAATLAIVVVALGSTIPLAAGSAAGPAITLSPTSAPAGAKVTAVGVDFGPRTKVQLAFDGVTAGMPLVNIGRSGSFRTSFTVPRVAAGAHTIAAMQVDGKVRLASGPTQLGAILATVTFMLGAPSTSASPSFTPAPSTSQTPAASASAPASQPPASSLPSLAPSPSAPVVVPTATPTATPTVTQTPSPTSTVAPAPTTNPTATPAPTPAPTIAPTAPPSGTTSGFVDRQGTRLTLNGADYVFVGMNIGTGICGNNASIETALDAVGSGQNAFRFWMLQQFMTRNGARDWSVFDRVLNAARARGQRVVVTLANHWADCEGSGGFQKTEAWYASGYKSQTQPNGTTTYREYVREVVTRYRSDPAVLMWQLVNEPQADLSPGGGCSSTADDTLKAFADDMARLIKSIDSNHLVNLGSIGDGNCGLANDQWKWVQSGADLDVLEIHQYHKTRYSGDQWNGTTVRIRQALELNKPLFNGEDGILLGSETATTAERAAAFDQKFAWHINGDGMVGELLWTWHNGRSPVSGHDVGPGDPVFAVFRKY